MKEKEYKKKIAEIYQLMDIATVQLHAALSALGKISAVMIDLCHESAAVDKDQD